MAPEMELPRYRCHKIVHALKIQHVAPRLTGAVIVPEDERYAAFEVDAEYVRKHNPQPGGYYVVYDDTYQSFSPAEPFEAGYTPIVG